VNIAPHKEQSMKHSLSITLALSSLALAACATRTVAVAPVPGPTTVTTVSTVPAASSTAVIGAQPAAARLSSADLQFVAVAAGAGMYEVEAARLAATRAANVQVKTYAQMLVDHHTANNNELTALLAKKGQRVAPGLPAALQQKVTMLSGLNGADFDREFIRNTGVGDHKAAIAAFEQSRGQVSDPDLQAFIDKTLPTLKSHLQQAQDIAGRMAG
jgi:putative membrane protein